MLIDQRGVIIAGNKTVAEAQADGRLRLRLRVIETDGTELIAFQRRDLDLATDPRAQALAVADNCIAELDLDWDEAALQDLHAAGVDLSPFFTEEEFAALVAAPTADLTDENAVVAPGPTTFHPGDLVVLGRHRLVCGDATVAADVARVLEGARPGLMATDPPYGVRYGPAWRHDAYPGQRTAVGVVANDDRADWTDALTLFPGDVAYVWHAGLHAGTVGTSLIGAGFDLRSQIIWVKQHFALSRGHYHWQHGQRRYSDLAIEIALTLRLIYHLPLRQAEGFLNSLFAIMKIDLRAPDYTTLSRRGQRLKRRLRPVATGEPIHLILDSTGLSIVGEGEWAALKHGRRGRRGWKKLHLGVDHTGVILAHALTDATGDDATTGLDLITAVDGDVVGVMADAAYDTVAIYDTAGARGATVVVPPARTANVSRRGPRSRARDRTINRVRTLGRRRWKKDSGYHRQARVENTFFRYKVIIGDGLRARSPGGQGSEAVLSCKILNRMTALGRPASYSIGR